MPIETGFSNPNTQKANNVYTFMYSALSLTNIVEKHITSKKGLTTKRITKAAFLPVVALFSNAASDSFRKQIDDNISKDYRPYAKFATDIASYVLPAYAWVETIGFKKYGGLKEGKYVVVAFSFISGLTKWLTTIDKN